MAISDSSWDGSASRFTDQQYERSCVLDRKKCGGDWTDKAPKERCSLPIKEPNGALSRAGVHAAAARLGSVKNACPATINAAKSALRSAYKQLGEDPPDSLRNTRIEKIYRDRALATIDHEWEFCRAADGDGDYLGTLAGHFAVFDRWAEINSPFEGHFMERVAPGAFAKTFQENQRNIRVLFNHGKDPSIGLKALGPIRKLEEDERGAYYEVSLNDTSYNRDLIPGLKDGQYGASFRFAVVREAFNQFPERGSDHNPEGIPESTIQEAKVREFGPVTFGAYEDATAGLRSLNDELIGMDLRMMAASDPKVVASFAKVLSGEAVGANVGTGAEEPNREAPQEPAREEPSGDEERNDPTAQDWSIGYQLKCLKGDLATIKATQLTDDDLDNDDDDAAVSAALDKIDAAIDEAIVAQAQDSRPDDGGDDNDEDDVYALTAGRSDSSDETSESREDSDSAPADRAPVRTVKPFGATLKKRAAPLKTNHTKEKPLWQL